MIWTQSLKTKLIYSIFKPKTVIARSAVDLAFKKHGSGSKYFITMHGLLGSKRNWESVSRKLAETTQGVTLALDLRNHGESPHTDTHTYLELAADVSQLMDKQNVKEATVIGHSMGGRTAMVLALTELGVNISVVIEPAKVSRLVCVDISPMSTPGILNNFFPVLIDAMNAVNFSAAKNPQEARIITKTQLSKVMDPSGMGFILMNIGMRGGKIAWNCNPPVLKKEFNNISTFPMAAVSGKTYNGPTLFVAGELSNYCPASDIDGIRTLFPKANRTVIPNVGHNVHAEDPVSFLNVLNEFIKAN